MSKLTKSVLAFFSCGVVAGLAFAVITARPEWTKLWFSVSEWWVLPTWRYWLLGEVLFVAAISVAYLWARLRGWVNPRTRAKFGGWTVVLLTSGLALALLWLYQLQTFVLAINFLAMPAALVVLLYLFSERFDPLIAGLIIVTNVLVALVASIPDLFLAGGLSIVAFQSLKALLSSGVLASLSGLWLSRGEKS